MSPKKAASEHPVVMTIAGSDASGGAGIQVRPGTSFENFSIKIQKSFLLYLLGRPEDVHCLTMLWNKRYHGSDSSEHYRGPRDLSDSAGIYREAG